MRLLITGGTGFIGKPLCETLLSQGHQLVLLAHKQLPELKAEPDQWQSIGSLSELDATEDFDAVINLAGAPTAARRWSQNRKRILLASRVDTTKALVRFIANARHRPECLISGSAVGYYGDQFQREVTEETQPQTSFSHQLCREWEAQALDAQQFKVRTCIVRIGLVLGPQGGFLQQMLPAFRFGLGGRFGDGKQWMPWVHRDDIIRLVLWLLETDACQGPYNATAPNPVTNAEFVRSLAEQLRRPAIFSLPSPLLKAIFGEMSELLLGGQKALPQRALQAGFEFNHEKLRPALADLLA